VYRWVDHTGELELQIEASTLAAVFEDALAAFAELVAEGAGEQAAGHEIALEASEPALLLADFLGELVFLAETSDFVPERFDSLELDEGHVRATVAGRLGTPAHLVKGVTYHGLELRREDDGFRAHAVLDV
jgi:protein archease